MIITSHTIRTRDGQVIAKHDFTRRAPQPRPVRITRPTTVGLGDLVAHFAQPIATVIDKATEHMLPDAHKTALAQCPACSRRHRKLNLICPDVLTCPMLGKLLDLLPDFARKPLLEAAAKYAKPKTPDATP